MYHLPVPSRLGARYSYGCVAGVVPWVAIGIYLLGPTAEIPGFVYAIFVSLFLFFNVFGGVLWVASLSWAGYLLGTLIPDISRYIHVVVVVVIPRCSLTTPRKAGGS